MANPSKTHRSTAVAVAHRLEAPVWRFHAAIDRVDAGRRYAKNWLDQPVRATRSVHLSVALCYTAVAMFSGLICAVISR